MISRLYVSKLKEKLGGQNTWKNMQIYT
jgi:hypothetical protein